MEIQSLLDPFQAGNYYNRAMGGSFSIKSVLPAIFPNDPELNYHNLEGVHNGSEAMTIFPRIKDMPAEEQKKARHAGISEAHANAANYFLHIKKDYAEMERRLQMMHTG